jgi:hypothetical protein
MTSGVKSMALATALALMTIGMGGAVSAADRQNLRGCMGPDDCGGGGSFRLNERLRGDGQNEPYRLRTDSNQRDNDFKNALKAERTGSFRKRIITRDNTRFDSNSNDLVRKRRLKTKDQDGPRQETQAKKKKQQAQTAWKFDRKKHKRRKHRDKWYRHFYGGFYYPVRYWLHDHDPYYRFDPSRVSCGEGRDIVRENGYRRVSTLECVGTTYTYLGRRSGESYRITVNARTGNIVTRKRT